MATTENKLQRNKKEQIIDARINHDGDTITKKERLIEQVGEFITQEIS